MTRAILRLAFVAAGVAMAIWLLPASVHIVDWPSSGPVRLGLLAPLRTLWFCFACAGVFVGVVVVAGLMLGPHVPQRIAQVVGPFAVLWFWAVPYLPWLPDRAPVLLVLAGPVRWGIACLALLGALWMLVGSRLWSWPRRLPGRWAVVAITFAVYCGFGFWSAAVMDPGGDEPHYLIIAQSLLLDHDLAIENNHTRGDYRAYFGDTLRPDYLRRGQNGAIYSIHAPGLPAMLAPAYAVAGYRGAVVLICLLAALAALAIFDLANLLAGRAIAWIAWAAMCLTVPFLPHGWMVYPEVPGALITAWAVLWLFQPLPARPTTWLWRGLALAALPWLHTKFSVLMVLLTGVLLIRLWPRLKAVAALSGPIATSTLLWLSFFYRIYGTFDPQAPYGDSARAQMAVGNIPRGVLGLLFDQKFGLLAYSPVYLLAAVGCWAMLRRPNQRLLGTALLATFVVYLASTTRYYMWWGGASAPARFLVPALPLVAPFIAITFQELRSPTARAAAGLLVAFSLCVAAAGVMWPERRMLFSAPHGFGQLVWAIQAGSPLAWTLPSFTEEPVRAPLALLAPWIFAAVLALVVVVLLARPKNSTAGFRVAAGFATFLLGGAVMAGAPAPEGRRLTATRGRLELMRDDDGDRLRLYDYVQGARLEHHRVLAVSTLNASRAAGELSDDPEQVAGPFALPPGRFMLRVWFSPHMTTAGRALITLRNRTRIAESDGTLADPASLTFDLPVEAAVYLAVSDKALARAVQQVEIVADSIVPRSARPRVDAHAIEAIGDRAGAYIVYADDETYPEGGVFWTRSTRSGAVWIAPGGASTLILTLHVGPLGGRVHLRVAGEDRSQDLMHDETRVLEIPLSRTHELLPITVGATQQFRPSDHAPGSSDTRWLGCQVRISLK